MTNEQIEKFSDKLYLRLLHLYYTQRDPKEVGLGDDFRKKFKEYIKIELPKLIEGTKYA